MTAVDAPTADQADPAEQRVARLTPIAIRYCYSGGIDGPEMAVRRFLADPEIRDALTAAEHLRELVAAHQWQERPNDSTWQACTCGELGCHLPDVLAGL